MHERPIGDLVDALRGLGASIDYLGNDGYPPLAINPATLRAGDEVRVRGDVSSQFLTALLMALPLTGTRTVIRVVGELISRPYVEITLATLRRFGVEVGREGGDAFIIPADARYASPGEVFVEGDASSASYFLAAGAIARRSGARRRRRPRQHAGRHPLRRGARGDGRERLDGRQLDRVRAPPGTSRCARSTSTSTTFPMPP